MPSCHREPEVKGAAFKLGHQGGLADPGVAPNEHDLRRRLCSQPESLVQLADLRLAAQQERRGPARHGHGVHRPRRGWSERLPVPAMLTPPDALATET